MPALDVLMRKCSQLKVPIAAHKTDGPTSCITFLGIMINTTKVRETPAPTGVSLGLGKPEDMHTQRVGILDHACVQVGHSYVE